MVSRFDAGKKKRLAAVRRLLADGPESAQLSTFADLLFDRAAAEDLVEYDPPALAGIARAAFAFFRHRSSPVKVGFIDLPAAAGSGRPLTAIEILMPNRPFIFDSVLDELQARGHQVRLVLHPILAVKRGGDGSVEHFSGPGRSPDAQRESLVHVHVPAIGDEAARSALSDGLHGLLKDVHRVTEDWRAMRARLRGAAVDFRNDHPPLPDAVVDEVVAFLHWLEDDNFVFLGMGEYAYGGTADAPAEGAVSGGLGLLRDPEMTVLRRGSEPVMPTPEIRAFLTSAEPLIVTKATTRTRVHRRDYMDYVGVKIFTDGEVAGELRVLGLFTSTAFTRSVQSIPFIRRKVAEIVRRAGFDPVSHSGKALLNILENYPRTELFQADEDNLFDSAMAILQLEERPRVRALARRDRFDRFVSVLVFVPRDRYSSDLRERIGIMLAAAFEGRVSAFFPNFSLPHLTRVQFIIGRKPGTGPDPGRDELETRIRAIVRTFADDLEDALNSALPGDGAAELFRNYAEAFGSDYKASLTAEDAVADIAIAEALGADGIEAEFRPRPNDPQEVTLRFHHLGEPTPLSRRVPLLENLGFFVINERTYCIARKVGAALYLHDMTLVLKSGAAFDPSVAARLRDVVLAVWRGQARNDGFNALILLAGLDWRQAALLRAIARYLRQTDIPYSLDYLGDALQRNPVAAGLLMARFAARFLPSVASRRRAEDKAEHDVVAALERVESLDDDTILRAFAQVIAAAVRTDFYADEGRVSASTIAFKVDPKAIPFVPAPRPFREIFVHSPEVDGIHMRFGPVARGGLRWSDRRQDFRTEVLGLVKAQQAKNAVIVPVGAKGGFVPMRLPAAGRDEIFEAGRQAYVKFVDRLLALTDDIEDGKVVPPAGIVRHDGDDPYLVVAADKGTATFSDTANAIALKRGFWLGDAFASGGSAGYDHKAMGITARGAWEAVKRHFREMDFDIQSRPFTVAGVGDMSGDVFGNGMLLSRCIKLVAAFDHRDIFVDPDPDLARSFDERERLFRLPRSTWLDYDRAALSRGGGVYSRSEKQIALSPEARKLLRLGKGALKPADVLAAILKAHVDLLWFGGIGTYVRGPDETNADVGDKANDTIRIRAGDIGAKVVGEGANLGMTARARIAYGLKGGRCNSDAIDNSAGVNTSDVEVNIKIALEPAVRGGRLSSDDRLTLLREMTDDVAALVLRNNYQQTLAISLEERHGVENLPNQMRLMDELETRELLDRSVEALADNATLEARAAAGKGLSRAEIATLLAFAKIALFDDLRVSVVPDDPYFARELLRYFPPQMRDHPAADLQGHRLRREIVATQLANSLVNRGGPTLLVGARDRTGASVAELTRAYAAARDSFRLQELHAAIEELDNKISGQLQLELFATVQNVLADRIGWFTRLIDPAVGIADLVGHFRDALDRLAADLPARLPKAQAKRLRDVEGRLTAGGVPKALAARIGLLPLLARAADVIVIADRSGRDLADAAAAFFAVAERFGFDRIDELVADIPTADYYDILAVQKARDSLEASQRDLARGLLANGGAADVAAWEESAGDRISATAEQVGKLMADRRMSMAKVTVAASLLAELARG